MKSDFWLFIIMRSFERVRTLRVEKRTLIILALGGIVFAGGLAFFGYEYFSLLQGRSHLMEEMNRLKNQIFTLDKKYKKVSTEGISPKPISLPIAIEELKVIRQENRDGFSVRFRLVNRNLREVPVSGTLVMVAKNETPRPPIYRVIPEMSLDSGTPQQPEKGIRFEIRRQKFVEAFFDSSSEEIFKTLTVYLYSPERKLILQKSVEIPEN
ncbi:MAG: hypothetical protein ABSB32_06245 [Thermodesulfobacteriota bacterium]|jgi:hypothetical protein